MSQESKIDDLRIRLAKALTWLDVPGVSHEQLNNITVKCHRIFSNYVGSERSLLSALRMATQALYNIEISSPEHDVYNDRIKCLQAGVSTIESCLKVISPSRIDVISNDLR